MREKSKFFTFILSFLPGLPHMYLGFADRGLIFLIVFFGSIAGAVGLTYMTYRNGFVTLLGFTLPLIWLVGLIDAFSLRKKLVMDRYENRENEVRYENTEEFKESNRKAITMALSIIPGAGHMFLGYQKKGLVIMGAFFFTIFFMGWLNLSLFLFVLPLIWFYGFFDAFHSLNGGHVENIDMVEMPSILPKIKPEWVGWGLILVGVFIIVERILYPLIPHEIRNYIQTSIVSLIFIIGGIRLLKKDRKDEEGEEVCKKDE